MGYRRIKTASPFGSMTTFFMDVGIAILEALVIVTEVLEKSALRMEDRGELVRKSSSAPGNWPGCSFSCPVLRDGFVGIGYTSRPGQPNDVLDVES